MVLSSGTFGRSLRHEGGVLTNGISAFIKEIPETSLPSSAKWGHSDKIDIYETGSRFSDTETVDSLI